MRVLSTLCALLLAGSFLAGCGGAASGGSAQVVPVAGQSKGKVAATLTIHVPKKVRRTSKGRRPRYISPSTQSALITIDPASTCKGCSPSIVAPMGLVPGSPSCVQGPAGTTCSVSFVLSPGIYTGTITTYDGPIACEFSHNCNVLSANQSFPLTIVAGAANTVGVTLYGIPSNLVMYPVTSNTEAYGRGILVGGVSSVGKVSLYAQDPDGNLILGPGAPVFGFTAQPTNGWSAAISGNVLQLNTASTFASTKFSQLDLNVTSPSCTESSALCDFPVVLNVRPMLALADTAGNAVHVLFTNRSTGALPTYATVTNGLTAPANAKFDAAGNLYVAESGGVLVYAPPYTAAPVKSIQLAYAPDKFAVSPGGNVAVAGSFFGTESFTVFDAPAYTTTTVVTVTNPYIVLAMAFNFAGGLWVGTNQGYLGFYAPHGTTPIPNLSVGRLSAIDVDENGDLVVANPTALTLTKYMAPSYPSGGPSTTVSNEPYSIVSLNATTALCTSAGAALYSPALVLASVTPISGTAPCNITADYVFDEYWLEAPYNATETQLYGPGTSTLVPFVANSISAFPAPYANY
jgi:hypothetical protein